MSGFVKFRSTLPPISPFDTKLMSESVSYIGAAGFEDRAMTVLNRFARDGTRIENAIGIVYRPYDQRNRLQEFRDRLEEVSAKRSWVTFDRYDPQNFQIQIPTLLPLISSRTIVVDVSAMSKFLIVITLQALRKTNAEVIIAYAEADVYHPTKDEFEKEKESLKQKGTTEMPDFLTSDVYRILHVTSLSSSSMQGYPIVLLAYPTFNHTEIVALHNELFPNCTILLEGKPHLQCDEWRLEAIREINRKVMNNPEYCTQHRTLSTFDYVENIESLDEIYQRYKYTHRIFISPTGSKLQTVAAFVFRQIHPDVQIVYPATRSFIGEYSEKHRELWSIRITNFSDFIATLDRFRMLR